VSGFVFEKLDLNDAYKITNFFTVDKRGEFVKLLQKDIYLDNGIQFEVSESFCSVSEKNVIRGIHFQIHNPQAKIVTVLSGAVLDYIVDLRPDSATFKQWKCVELSRENHCSLYVPRGFGHGFCAKEDGTIMLYLCEGAYDKETDTGILYNDPDLNITWPTLEQEIHSDRDLKLMTFQEYMRHPMEIGNRGLRYV
jgi:dTDP-4-dehydrorhamnose 3,5-epimerase